jgi:hypothetical protein
MLVGLAISVTADADRAQTGGGALCLSEKISPWCTENCAGFLMLAIEVSPLGYHWSLSRKLLENVAQTSPRRWLASGFKENRRLEGWFVRFLSPGDET